MRAVSWLFWIAVAWIVYAYVGYLFLLRVLSLLRPKRVVQGDISPQLTVIVTVHNGSEGIRRKLSNLLEQDYPADLMEIVVADDGSDDGTDRIVREEFGPRGIRLVRLPEHGGKERAQRIAVDASRGKILVFTDVGTRLDRGGLARIVRNFADPSVGAVSSEDRLLEEGDRSAGGEGGYVGYEMRLRRLESQVGSLVGLSGSFFAARREVCADFSERLASDFRTALVAVRLGLRSVCDEGAIGYYRDVARETPEFDRKVRTVVRGMTVLFAERSLLNPFRYGLFSWQLFSHKLARWTVPFAMIASLGASAYLAGRSPWYGVALGLQLIAYVAALAACRLPRLSESRPVRALRYLVEANCAILVAWIRYLWGDRILAWSPSSR